MPRICETLARGFRLLALSLVMAILLPQGMPRAQAIGGGQFTVTDLQFLVRLIEETDNARKRALGQTLTSDLASRAAEFRRSYFQSLVHVTVSVADNKGTVIIGAPMRVTATIHNDSEVPVYIRPEGVKLSIPSQLTGVRKIDLPDNLTLGEFTRIDPGSEFDIAWDQDPQSLPKRIWANILAPDFKPDTYTVTANIQLHYDVNQLNSLYLASVSSVLKMLEQAIGAPETKKFSDQILAANLEPRDKTYLTRIASQHIFVDFMPLFVAFCAIPGGIAAVLVRWLFQAASARATLGRSYPNLLQVERRRLQIEAVKYAVTALMLPFIAVAAAKATHNVDWGVAIRVYDVLGAIASGFVFQFISMKYGEPMLDKLVERNYPN